VLFGLLFHVTFFSIICFGIILTSQNVKAHPVFTEPFILNYSAILKAAGTKTTIINYDSNTNLLTLKVQSVDSPLNKTIKLNKFQDHELRDKIGEFRILDLNFTHNFCTDTSFCEVSTLQIVTPSRSGKLVWTIDSEESLRRLNFVEKMLKDFLILAKVDNP
jgi:CTP:phosphocholine cytidylyltransferase-like protein